MNFIPAPQPSPNPLTKYYFILISSLYKYVLSIFLMRAIPMKAGNGTPIHGSPQQLKSSKLNINLEQKKSRNKVLKIVYFEFRNLWTWGLQYLMVTR